MEPGAFKCGGGATEGGLGRGSSLGDGRGEAPKPEVEEGPQVQKEEAPKPEVEEGPQVEKEEAPQMEKEEAKEGGRGGAAGGEGGGSKA